MPVFTVEAPDGRRLKIEAADEATAIRGAQEHYASLQKKTVPQAQRPQKGAAAAEADYRKSLAQGEELQSRLGRFARLTKGPLGGTSDEMRSRVQGATLGWSDELYGAIGEGGVNAYNALANATGFFDAKPYTGQEYGDAVRKVERQRQAEFRREKPVTALANEIGGGVALPGAKFVGGAKSLTSAVARSGAVGAAYGGVSGAGTAEDGKRVEGAKRGAKFGAAVGALTPVAARAAQRAVGGGASSAPKLPQAQQLLVDEGVTLTPGQMAGGVVRSAEELATSVPVLRDVVRGAQRRGVEDLNRAAVNRVLAPIGEKLPSRVKPGFEAVEHANKALSKAYDDALGGIRGLAPDEVFARELDEALALTDDILDGGVADRVRANIQGRLQRVFGENGASGEQWKALDSDLAEMSRTAIRQGQHEASDVFDAVRGVLRTMLERQASPEAARKVAQANLGWANLMRVERAAKRATNGVFSPNQLKNAVTSMGGRQAAQGKALMQDLANAGADVLPQTIPDSGTPIRTLATLGVGGMAGGAVNPAVTGAVLTGVGAASIPYARPVLQAVNRAARTAPPMAQRPLLQARQAAGRQIAAAAPALAIPSAAAAGVDRGPVEITLGGRPVAQLPTGEWIYLDTGELL